MPPKNDDMPVNDYQVRFKKYYEENGLRLPEDFSDEEKEALIKDNAVNLIGHYENEVRIAEKFLVIPYSIPKGCTATYFPEANVLVPIKSKARISNTPASKGVIISIKK